MTLQVSGLSAVRSGRTILHPTSLEIAPRARLGLVGSSGSGKSTLGHAVIDDLQAQGHSVAHVPQSPDEALDPLRTMAFHWREAEAALGLAQTMALLDRVLSGRDTAMLLITHDLGLAARRVDRLLVMDAGHLVEQAATYQILEQPKSKAARALSAHRSWVELPC